MKFYSILLGLVLLACNTSGRVGAPMGAGSPMAQAPCPTTVAPVVCFAPNRGRLDCTKMIVNYIDAATRSIYVQAYNFTSPDIAQALIRAHARGVIVEVILDRSVPTERNGQLATLLQAGIPSMVDASHAIAHNKVMIIDQAVVLSGSFNFTVSAEERNAENMVALTDVALAANYMDNWSFHKLHAKPQ